MRGQLPIALSQASGVPFYRQVEDQIAQLVSAGQLKPGDALPSVRELAQDLLVSLITIRRAYADLEAAGIVVRRQGLGTFVAEGVARAAEAKAQRRAIETLEAAVRSARQAGLGAKEILAATRHTLGGGGKR